MSNSDKLKKALIKDGLITQAHAKKREPASDIFEAAIGAIFSIRAQFGHWDTVRNKALEFLKANKIADRSRVSGVLAAWESLLDASVFNRQVLSGRLKSEVLYEFLQCLDRLKVQTLDQVKNGKPSLLTFVDCELRKIRGVGPAIVQFFYILCGQEQFVKGDTMVASYVNRAIEAARTYQEAAGLLVEVAGDASVSPADLDLAVWQFERTYRKLQRQA